MSRRLYRWLRVHAFICLSEKVVFRRRSPYPSKSTRAKFPVGDPPEKIKIWGGGCRTPACYMGSRGSLTLPSKRWWSNPDWRGPPRSSPVLRVALPACVYMWVCLALNCLCRPMLGTFTLLLRVVAIVWHSTFPMFIKGCRICSAWIFSSPSGRRGLHLVHTLSGG